ncbi:DUF5658 family protein [Anaeromyxobacter paludicola]|uniref:DUF5658 domain-containing protein n=1 Tax=Anaeromyxobacter paludicola TaxID=2918171 RepID=A0ABM7XFU5_9BACT|nr:DUF5658 family protein [Anaeromyxobacter paludicola]BDG10713.1 hypothetical protein AMPC_38260 [Anaeromyxobacter paludicola]
MRSSRVDPRALVALFVAFNAVDAVTTAWLVGVRGAGEANPVMGAVLSLGTAPFVFVKLGLAFVLAAFTARYAVRVLRALCVAFAGIAAWQVTLCFTM